MREPWIPVGPREYYVQALDYIIEDKLDRLREAVLALAAIALADDPTGADVIRLIGTIRDLETAGERHEHHG